MHVLLAPVLAQLLTLGLTERVEGNYVTSSQPTPGIAKDYFESKSTTTPNGVLVLDWQHASLSFGYAPTLTIVPLEGPDPEALVYHQGFVAAQYAWRHTTLRISQTAGYGERDFYREALTPYQAPQAATPPQQTNTGNNAGNTGNTGTNTPPANTGTSGTGMTGGTPPTTGTGGTTGGSTATGGSTIPARTAGTITNFGVFRTSAVVDQTVSRNLTWRVGAGYGISGGMGEASKLYPIVRGPDANASVRYQLDATNTFSTVVTGQYVIGQDGSRALLLIGGEDYTHQFNRQTTLLAGAGISFGRSEVPSDYLNREPLYGVFPVARVALTHGERVGRGTLTLAIGAATAPVVDITTASLDPRIGGYVTAAWAVKRFMLSASGFAAISLAPNSPSALNSVSASLGAHYDLKSGFLLDGGVRAIWQEYAGQNTIAPSLVFFLAVSWIGLLPVNGHH